MLSEKTQPLVPLEKVRVGMFTDLDPSDSYTTVTIEVPHRQEDLSPGEARELARLLNVYADAVEKQVS